ncbi:MAG: hypothetical protein HKP58_05495 [Desulfatitalea sp.]|nr:hypothetical protein [Desulfatitalea sp.]NNJ99848.1 hypothetical protein [Desulfatitalea sp.]
MRVRNWIYTGLMLLPALASGCATGAGDFDADRKSTGTHAPADKVAVYIYRESNYKGGGRTHLLQLDDRTLGPLTGDNYYRMVLWPGHYYLNVHLPAESFLGEKNPPVSVGQRLLLEPRLAGRTFVYVYEDGAGLRYEETTRAAADELEASRVLAKDFGVRDTARLKSFMRAGYDGPEMFGSPHGQGTLTWPDGCRYVGIFDHGALTETGKFYFSDGRIFMGQLFQGRPKGKGALFTPTGQVLFAGTFRDEKPHGIGFRSGRQGPELCRFEHGEDVTPAIEFLAEAAAEDQEAQLLAFFFGEAEVAAEAEQTATPTDVLPHAPEEHTETTDPPSYMPDPVTSSETAAPETLDRDQFIKMLTETRRRRGRAMRDMVIQKQQVKIEAQRAWCENEWAHGRRRCICAPFDPESGQWQSCKK